MNAEVLTVNKDREFVVLVETEENVEFTIVGTDGKRVQTGKINGETIVTMLPGESLHMQSLDSSEHGTFVPNWDSKRMLTEAEYNKIENIRKASLDKVPGIHIGI